MWGKGEEGGNPGIGPRDIPSSRTATRGKSQEGGEREGWRRLGLILVITLYAALDRTGGQDEKEEEGEGALSEREEQGR